MGHDKVVRRSLSEVQWTGLEFDRVDELICLCEVRTDSWESRLGNYDPDGYTWESSFAPIAEGDLFGRPDGTMQFRNTVSIPSELEGKRVWFDLLTGAEVIVHCNGKLLDGIDPNRRRTLLTESASAGDTFEFLLEAYTRSKPDDERHPRTKSIRGCVQRFRAPCLVALDEEALGLRYDLDVVQQMAFRTTMHNDARECYQRQVRELLKIFPLYDAPLEDLRRAIPMIRAFIAKNILTAESPFSQQGRLACVAHSHLDIAYHWRVRQSVQKNARTCLIQLRLMDRYPELIYSHTQAWCYEMLERYYPELFDEVKTRVAEGRWELVGGMYVEPDCNIPSAESLVRQILYGKLYFLDKFGVEVDNCWLPDVFGNSAILPQILKLGGIDYFVSNKMSTWNDTNRFPHDNFVWRGLDGSEVFACVPPVHFITWMEPQQLVESWEAFQDKATFSESLQMYGYGDGGSGVTEEMLEHYRRIKDLPHVPELRMCTGKDYLHETFADPRPGGIPVWDGELYLEMHRGTFTSKGELKAANRRGEILAGETEALCAMASLHGNSYPWEKLREAWKLLLLNQFHDIIPGSHTHGVYVDAVAAYEQAAGKLRTLRSAALQHLTGKEDGQAICVINPTGHPRGGLAILENTDAPNRASLINPSNGESVVIQRLAGPGSTERTVAHVDEIAPMSGHTYEWSGISVSSSSDTDLNVSPACLENRFYRVELDAQGQVTRIHDKIRRREAITPGTIGNEWQLFEDKPGTYNAWDIIRQYADHPIAIPSWTDIEVVEEGPLSIAVHLRRSFRDSHAEQIVRLYRDLPRIDFDTWIDWQETEKLLKVAFPVQVLSRSFTTDTSAGGIERETHANTSWQEARFEVCCHRWMDMGEGLFGVAILNDGKYGCDVRGNIMRLTLLKAPIRPDRESDKGQHRFTYSLMTHGGDWRRGGVVEQAEDLNAPLTAISGAREGRLSGPPLVRISDAGLKCQSLKCAEDNSGDLVLRLVDLYGTHGTATIEVGFEFESVTSCDLLERTVDPVCEDRRLISLSYAPYQIQTLRFRKPSV